MSTVAEIEAAHTLTFQQALDMAEVLARNALPPELHERLSCAVALVKDGAVLQLDDGHTWAVASTSTPGKEYHVNATCPCADAHYRTQKRCKHALAVYVSRKVLELMQAPAAQESGAPQAPPVETVSSVETEAPPDPSRPRRTIPAKYIQKLQGKDFVRFAGLLQAAQADGLVELSAVWTHNDAEVSLAHAVAIFADGRRYEESGDSTPQNAVRVGLHWRRMSLTRAKARCLRDALSIEECSLEEME